MDANLKKVSCDPMCGFMIQSHDEDEIVEDTMKHAKKAHNKDMKSEEVVGMMQAV